MASNTENGDGGPVHDINDGNRSSGPFLNRKRRAAKAKRAKKAQQKLERVHQAEQERQLEYKRRDQYWTLRVEKIMWQAISVAKPLWALCACALCVMLAEKFLEHFDGNPHVTEGLKWVRNCFGLLALLCLAKRVLLYQVRLDDEKARKEAELEDESEDEE